MTNFVFLVIFTDMKKTEKRAENPLFEKKCICYICIEIQLVSKRTEGVRSAAEIRTAQI